MVQYTTYMVFSVRRKGKKSERVIPVFRERDYKREKNQLRLVNNDVKLAMYITEKGEKKPMSMKSDEIRIARLKIKEMLHRNFIEF